MKKKKFVRVLIVSIVLALLVMPVQSFAADKEDMPLQTAPTLSTRADNTPPPDEISPDPDYSEGFVLTRSTVSGGCSIAKLSSSSLNMSGYTTCSPSDPAVKVTLKLQAYYDGAWHTLVTKVKAQSGTYVSLSQAYNVTSGYYYRIYATHSIADGTTTYSWTNGLLIN